MKTLPLLLAASSVLSLVSGCITPDPPPPPQPIIVVGPSAAAGQASTPNSSVTVDPESRNGADRASSSAPASTTLRFSRSFPRVAIVAKPGAGVDAAFAERVADGVRTAVAARDIRVEPAGTDAGADIRIDLGVSAEPYVRDGEWVVFDASAEARAEVRESKRDSRRDASDRFLGARTFEARGARTLGDKAALEGAGTVLVPRVADWATDLLRPEVCGLAAETVRVSWSNVAPSRIPACRQKALEQISALPGVRDCRVASASADGPSDTTLLVVYVADSLPQGLSNAIAAAYPALGL